LDIVDSVVNFFKGLFRQRINAAQAGVKSKISDAQTRARVGAANAVNSKIDGAVDKAKEKAKEKTSPKEDSES